jgi:8-oxo-dGTP pyrophosphatase MutT (NUDIX family)
MGAGVIPFAVINGEVCFLFQKTFTGRKVGYYIDFGGGLGEGEDYRETAIREFIEETETMYFSDDIEHASRTDESVREQIPIVKALFDETLTAHPDWCCRRAPCNPRKPKQWQTFFIEFPYRDIAVLNLEWEKDTNSRFKKQRELVWVSGSRLLEIYDHTPEILWKRVRQLENAIETVHAILLSKEPCLTSGATRSEERG